MNEPQKQTKTTDTTGASPSQTPSDGNRPAASSSSGLTTVMVLLALVLGGYSFFRTISPTAAMEGLVVVDSDRLAAAYIRQALADPQADTAAAQQKLAGQLGGIQAKLDAMAADGRIIVRKSAVLTYPPGTDITAQVAAELGIVLSPESVAPSANGNGLSVTASVPLLPTVSNASDARLGSQLD